MGDTTWQQKTFDLYEEGWHITDDHIARHRAEGGARPLVGREREFAIKCDC